MNSPRSKPLLLRRRSFFIAAVARLLGLMPLTHLAAEAAPANQQTASLKPAEGKTLVSFHNRHDPRLRSITASRVEGIAPEALLTSKQLVATQLSSLDRHFLNRFTIPFVGVANEVRARASHQSMVRNRQLTELYSLTTFSDSRPKTMYAGR